MRGRAGVRVSSSRSSELILDLTGGNGLMKVLDSLCIYIALKSAGWATTTTLEQAGVPG